MFAGISPELLQKPEIYQARLEESKIRYLDSVIDQQIASGKFFLLNVDGTKRPWTEEKIAEYKLDYKKITSILTKRDLTIDKFSDVVDEVFAKGEIHDVNADGSHRLLSIEEREEFKNGFFDLLRPGMDVITAFDKAIKLEKKFDEVFAKGEIHHVNDDGSHRPLTIKEIKEFKAGFFDSLRPGMAVTAFDESVKLEKMADESLMAHQKLTQEAHEFRSEAEQHAINTAQLEAELAAETKELTVENFYGIFNNNPLPKESYSVFFDTYLTDNSVSIEDDDEGEDIVRLNSMTTVIKYLHENPEKKWCNFTVFQSEVYDVPTFADYLKTPAGHNIKRIAFAAEISEAVKEVLADTVAARAETLVPLEVVYL